MKQFQLPSVKILYRGDIVCYELECSDTTPGRAFLRTTLGNGRIRFCEITDNAENGTAVTGRSWHDLAMEKISARRYSVSVPLNECGVFESKCFFIPDDPAQSIRWVAGSNFVLKVESPSSVAGNSIYTAFTRLFDFKNTEKNTEK